MNILSIKKILLLIPITVPSFSQTKSYDLIVQVNNKLPEYGLIVEEKSVNDSKSYIIKIYQTDSKLLIQSINLADYGFYYGEYDYPYVDSLIDVNFDGYRDLCVVTAIGQNGKNWGYDTFIFNIKDKRFYIDENFPTVYNILADDSLKQIYESYWNGCLECITYNTYIVQNNKLLLIKSDEQNTDDEYKIRRFIKTYKNGKLISTEEVELREE